MITELYEKLKRSYVVSLFSKKRPISDDDEDPPCVIEPPFKRNKYFVDGQFTLTKPGSLKYYKRSFDGGNEPRLSTLSFSSMMNNPKSGSERNIALQRSSGGISRVKSRIYSKENSEGDGVEYLGTSTKVPTPIPAKYDPVPPHSRGGAPSPRSPFSSFKFSPSLTSTINRGGEEGIIITKRRPLRSPVSRPSDQIYSLTSSSKSLIHKRATGMMSSGAEVSNRWKRRNVLDALGGSTGLRKLLTTRESFRLDDKERYRQLLQQYTNTNLSSSARDATRKNLFSTSFFGRSVSSSSCGGAITRSHLDPISTCKTRFHFEKDEAAPTPSLSLSLSKRAPGTSLRRPHCETPLPSSTIPVIDLEDPNQTEKEDAASPPDDDTDDIFITKEVTAPKVIKNSLEDHLQKSRTYNDDWFIDMKQYYRARELGRASEIASERETQLACEETRRAVERSLLDKVAARISQLDIKFPVKVVELPDEDEEEPLPELTPEIQNVIERALKGGPASKVLVEKFNIQITRRDIHTLAGLNWLNDEVINFYMNLLVERGANDNFASVYAFNTFFYSKLVKMGYSSVKRWTKKVNIFSYDLLLIPVHLGMHWCLATVDFRHQAIRYYDSMLGNNQECLRELRKYLRSEHEDKLKAAYDESKLSAENVKEIPQQMNGSDCGMFSCKFAEYLSRGAAITFTQEHMPYFRRRMVYEIVTKRLM